MVIPAKRPKLLLVAWNFPPAPSIGSVRTWNIAKHLARLGWDITVVTPDRRLMRRLENPESIKSAIDAEGIRQIFTDHSWRFLAPNHLNCRNTGLNWVIGGVCRRITGRLGISRGIGWIRSGERACAALNPEDVDLILASGPPFCAFVLAERLSKKLGRPYVLDYRDPWWTEIVGILPRLRPLVNRLEARLLKGSAAITIVSPSWARDLDSQFKVGPKLHVITNGYDEEDLADVKPYDFGHFAIVYAGILYPPERVITPVLAALHRLQSDDSAEAYFHYYGDDEARVKDEAARLGILSRVKLHGRVPRAEALSAIKGANVAVVIASVFRQASAGIKGWIPAKLFEIIGLGTPIILLAAPGTDVESVAEPTGLARRITGDDIDGLTSLLKELMKGSSHRQANVSSITWDYLAGRFDRLLRATAAESSLVGQQFEAVGDRSRTGLATK